MTGLTGFTSSPGIGIACVGVFGLIGFAGLTSLSDIGILLTFLLFYWFWYDWINWFYIIFWYWYRLCWCFWINWICWFNITFWYRYSTYFLRLVLILSISFTLTISGKTNSTSWAINPKRFLSGSILKFLYSTPVNNNVFSNAFSMVLIFILFFHH